MPALELVRLSTGIAHGLALEQLMNREKVDARMIELAFTPIHQSSEPENSSARQEPGGNRQIEQRREDGRRGRGRGR